jgi:hypothetical protein
MTDYKKPISDVECKNLIENKIGEGTRRIVYSVKNNPNVVIKEMKNIFPGSNMYEHFVWNFVSSTKLSNVFGKCFTISESGKYLIMEYLANIDKTDYEKIPLIPSWCNDKKPDNFGKDEYGNIKYRDYDLLKHEEIGALLANDEKPFFII